MNNRMSILRGDSKKILLPLFLTGLLSIYGIVRAQQYGTSKPENTKKFELELNASQLESKIQSVYSDFFSMPSGYGLYCNETQDLSLKGSPREMVQIRTKVGYNGKAIKILMGVGEDKAKKEMQIDGLYLWLISGNPETSTSQRALVLDRSRKNVGPVELGTLSCEGEMCENLLSISDRIIFEISKKLGLKKQEDLTTILGGLDFRIVSRAKASGDASKISDKAKGKAYISYIPSEMIPIRMFSFPETKIYEINIITGNSEVFGLVLLGYVSKLNYSLGNTIQKKYQSEPFFREIYFNQ